MQIENADYSGLALDIKEIEKNKDELLGKAPNGDFADMLASALQHVNGVQKEAGALVKAFENGDDSVSLIDVMIARQQSGIVTTATYEVKKKALDAFNEIMNLQF